uniref:Uncharacterized protein n=1 Tax=Knipowitschia caucasica TaxID=637954 RepID=A0AAV2JIF7_KNICA
MEEQGNGWGSRLLWSPSDLSSDSGSHCAGLVPGLHPVLRVLTQIPPSSPKASVCCGCCSWSPQPILDLSLDRLNWYKFQVPSHFRYNLHEERRKKDE